MSGFAQRDADLLAQIDVLRTRRKRLRARLLALIVGALTGAAVMLAFYLLLP